MSCLSLWSPPGLFGPLFPFFAFLLILGLPLLWGLSGVGYRFFTRRVRRERETGLEFLGLDPEVVRHVKPWLTRLAEFGFRESTLGRSDDGAGQGMLVWRLVNREWKSLVVLRGMDRIDRNGRPVFSLSFHSFLEDGRYVVTAEPGVYEVVPSDWLLSARSHRGVEKQWHRHHQRVVDAGSAAVLPASPIDALRQREDGRFEAAVAEGSLKRGRSDRYRVAWRGLPALLAKRLLAALPGNAPRASRRDLPAPDPDYYGDPLGQRQTSADQTAVHDLKRFRKLVARERLHPVLRGVALVAIIYGCCRLFPGMGSAWTAAVVLAIVIVHQLGRWVVETVFGLRGQVVATVGKFWRPLAAMLAGPLPGMAAGLAILAYGRMDPSISDDWLNAALMAIALNAVTLLPFRPLVGAKIADLLFFRNWPKLRLSFTVLALAAAVAGGLWLGQMWPRAVAAALLVSLALDVRHLIRTKSGSTVQWLADGSDADRALLRIFRERRENEGRAFFTKRGWHLRAQAMLERVMRREVGWLSRFCGGWVYSTACLVPLLAVLALGATLVAGDALPWIRHAMRLGEFRRQLPEKPSQELDEGRTAAIQALNARTVEIVGVEAIRNGEPVSEDEREAIVEQLGAAVDRLDWQEVAAAVRAEETECAWIWLEVARLRLERAAAAGRWDESLRRSEILLHAVSQLRPVDHADLLRGLQASERWALSVVAASFGKVALTDEDLGRIRDRIAYLRRQSRPQRDAYLLVEGWGARHRSELELARASLGEVRTFGSGAALVRDCYERSGELWTAVLGSDREDGASVAVARYWSLQVAADRLPEELPEGVVCEIAEAEHIRDYFRRRTRLEWLRMAVLHSIRLQLEQSRVGSFPSEWSEEVPGGAVLKLVAGEPPVLELRESEDGKALREPAWLDCEPEDKPFRLNIPLSRRQPGAAIIAGP